MTRVIVESPFRSEDPVVFARNLRYARRCMRDCMERGECPFASHLLYPQFLNDGDPAERAWGIEAGLLWASQAARTVVYMDLGVTAGMRQGIEHAEKCGRPVVPRALPNWSYNQ